MRLSSKSRHAVAAMIDLGVKSARGPVALVDVLDDQDISLSYLEQIFSKLKNAELVKGVRGPRGGYRLARSAEEISVAEIVHAVEDESPRGRKSRLTGQKSDAHLLWDGLSGQIAAFLNGISLGQLLERAHAATRTRPETRRYYDDYMQRRRAA